MESPGVSVRVPQRLLDRIDAECRRSAAHGQCGRNRSTFINLAVVHLLDALPEDNTAAALAERSRRLHDLDIAHWGALGD